MDNKKQVKQIRGKERKISTKQMILTIIVGVAMITSAMLMFSPQQQPTTNTEDVSKYMENYNTTLMMQNATIVKIEKKTDEAGMFVNGLKSPLYSIINSTLEDVEGIEDVKVEATDKYLLFKFKKDQASPVSFENFIKDIEQKEGSSATDIRMVRKYYANLSVKLFDTNEIEVFAEPGLEVGDHIYINLLNKYNKTFSKLIGIESSMVPDGSNLSAEVLNVTATTVTGDIVSDFDWEAVSEELTEKFGNVTGVNYMKPNFIVNSLVSNDTMNETASLPGVEVREDNVTNTTTIEFTGSKSDILEILTANDLNYTSTNGTIYFNMKSDTDDEQVTSVISKYGGTENIKVQRTALVSVAPIVVLEGSITTINNPGNFQAMVKPKTKQGDVIKVKLIYYTMSGGPTGDVNVPYAAEEI